MLDMDAPGCAKEEHRRTIEALSLMDLVQRPRETVADLGWVVGLLAAVAGHFGIIRMRQVQWRWCHNWRVYLPKNRRIMAFYRQRSTLRLAWM